MSKHTKGPWRWWPCKDGSFKTSGDYAQIASGNVQVAKVQILSVTEEDLRLMAAAPELLKSLVAMVEAWNMVCDTQGWERDHIQQQKDATAVIAKATGCAS